MRHTLIAFALVFTSVSAIACSSETAGSSPSSDTVAAAATPGSFCEAFCQKISSCDTSEDLQTCTESCEGKIGSAIQKLRSDVASETMTCWEKSDCRKVLDGDRLGECLEEATVSASPSPAAKAFCDALANGLGKCDSGLDRAQCLTTAKVYSEETIEQAKKCSTKTCSNILPCVDATF